MKSIDDWVLRQKTSIGIVFAIGINILIWGGLAFFVYLWSK